MRIPRNKIPQIAKEVVQAITRQGDIETEHPAEVGLDVQAVLEQYVTDEQTISDKARDLVAARGLSQSELGRTKHRLAEQRGVGIGEDAIDYLLGQLLEMLMHSGSVEEIYAEDHVLKRKMRIPLRQALSAEQDLDTEVRRQMKHVQEGTQLWEVEYQRMMEDIRRRKGL